jgi:hypothetical protein
MSDNTTSGENTPEDNELIRKLRSDLKIANQKIKTAAEDAVAQVERGSKAAGLMPEGFKGLADIFASEVDGELDAASAAEWLKGRGFSASSDETVEEVADTATELQKVTDLGGAVAAAGSLTPEDTILKQLGEVVDPNAYQSLSDVVEAIDGIVNG